MHGEFHRRMSQHRRMVESQRETFRKASVLKVLTLRGFSPLVLPVSRAIPLWQLK